MANIDERLRFDVIASQLEKFHGTSVCPISDADVFFGWSNMHDLLTKLSSLRRKVREHYNTPDSLYQLAAQLFTHDNAFVMFALCDNYSPERRRVQEVCCCVYFGMNADGLLGLLYNTYRGKIVSDAKRLVIKCGAILSMVDWDNILFTDRSGSSLIRSDDTDAYIFGSMMMAAHETCRLLATKWDDVRKPISFEEFMSINLDHGI